MSKKRKWLSHYAGANNPCHEGDVVEVICGCCDCAKADTFMGKILLKRRAVRQAYAGEVPWEQVHKYRIIDFARMTDAIEAARNDFLGRVTIIPLSSIPSPIGYWESFGGGGSGATNKKPNYDTAVSQQEKKKITRKNLTLVKG